MKSEEISRKLVEWIKDKVVAADARGVIFGLSGGVDSAVVALLCKKAFPDNSLGVIMPCYSDPKDIEDARLVAKKFEIDSTTVVLDETYDKLVNKLKEEEFCEALDSNRKRLAFANLKPRLRMTTLYYFANLLNCLVVGTGNRSERMVGYFTKYGDGAADILPLGNLLKTQVKEVARYLGVPKKIIDKPPSAGLWKGQTDEGEMGVTYEEIDAFLSGHISVRESEKINFMIRRSEHKRMPPDTPDF